MPYTTVVAGTTITASWANANLRDQVVTPFATTGARDSAISSPVFGMTEYVYSADVNEGLSTYTSSGVWRPPWNLPWGKITEAQITADSATATATADVAGLAVTWTSIANRKYRLTLDVTCAGTVVDDLLAAYITTTGSAVIKESWQPVTNAFRGQHHISVEVSPGAGATSYKVRQQRNSGTGTSKFLASATNPGRFWVEDVGPSGAPA